MTNLNCLNKPFLLNLFFLELYFIIQNAFITDTKYSRNEKKLKIETYFFEFCWTFALKTFLKFGLFLYVHVRVNRKETKL